MLGGERPPTACHKVGSGQVRAQTSDTSCRIFYISCPTVWFGNIFRTGGECFACEMEEDERARERPRQRLGEWERYIKRKEPKFFNSWPISTFNHLKNRFLTPYCLVVGQNNEHEKFNEKMEVDDVKEERSLWGREGSSTFHCISWSQRTKSIKQMAELTDWKLADTNFYSNFNRHLRQINWQ